MAANKNSVFEFYQCRIPSGGEDLLSIIGRELKELEGCRREGVGEYSMTHYCKRIGVIIEPSKRNNERFLTLGVYHNGAGVPLKLAQVIERYNFQRTTGIILE